MLKSACILVCLALAVSATPMANREETRTLKFGITVRNAPYPTLNRAALLADKDEDRSDSVEGDEDDSSSSSGSDEDPNPSPLVNMTTVLGNSRIHESNMPNKPVPRGFLREGEELDRQDNVEVSFARATDRAEESVPCGFQKDIVAGNTYTLTSPDFPSNYPANSYRCSRRLNVPANIKVSITCDVFRLRSGAKSGADGTCSGDFVAVYMKKGSERLDGTEYMCGTDFDSNKMVLTVDEMAEDYTLRFDFNSDGAQQDRGFECKAVAIDVSETTAPPPEPPPPAPAAVCGACGAKPLGSDPTDRIVGGAQAQQNEWPWQVGIKTYGARADKPFCGGTIISPDYILTAAHCVDGKRPGQLAVITGMHDWTEPSPLSRIQRKPVSAIKMHPSYSGSTVNNDFALLKLSSPLTFNSHVHSACLPSAANANNQYAGRDVWVTGWGTTSSGGSQPDRLREVKLRTRANSDCGNYQRGAITSSMVCAAPAPGGRAADSCQGDSGGPMVTRNSAGCYMLVGVVSWGFGCASPGYPGVYARVTSALTWINNNSR